MENRRIDWGHFRSAVLGGVVVVLVMSALPVSATVVESGVNAAASRSATMMKETYDHNRDGVVDMAADADMLDGHHSSEFLPVKDVAADSDKLDGLHANELIRVAHEETYDAVNADGLAVSTTIIAPNPGVLVMSGSVDASGSNFDGFLCWLHVDGAEVKGSQRTSIVHAPIDAPGFHTSNGQENCSADGAVEVDAGIHTVGLFLFQRDSASFGDAAVWVIYVPFGGNGASP